MRNSLKRFIIAGIALFVAGVLTFVIGMSIIGWDFYKLDTAKYTAKQFETEEKIVAVSLDVDSFPITVKSGDATSLEYYEASDSEVSVEVSDGVLKIHEHRTHNPFKGMFTLGRLKHRYTLTVVSGEEIKIESTSATVRFDGLEMSSLTVTSSNADLNLRGCKIEAFTVNSTNLDLNINDCSIGVLDLKSGANGDIDMSACNGQSMSMDYTNIDFNIENSQYESMDINGTNIDFIADDLSVTSISIDGVNTDVELNGITVDELRLSGTNLDADICVNGKRGEYGIFSDGRDLPHSSAGSTDKKITLSGVNNDVNLEFSGD